MPKAAELKDEDKLFEDKLLMKHASAWLLLGAFLISSQAAQERQSLDSELHHKRRFRSFGYCDALHIN